MEKWIKQAVALLAVFGLIVAADIIMLASGKITPSYSGFAVDSEGKVYVGTASAIEVYRGGELVQKLSPKTSRGYAFTMENDKIILSTGDKFYTITLDGEVTAQTEDDGSEISRISRIKSYTAADGAVYKKVMPWGRTQIVKDGGQAVYKMPILDYIMRLLMCVWAAAMVVFVPLIIYRSRKVA